MTNVEMYPDDMEIRLAQARLEQSLREIRSQFRDRTLDQAEFDDLWAEADRRQEYFDRVSSGWLEVRRFDWRQIPLDKLTNTDSITSKATHNTGENECEIDEIINFPRKSSQKPSTRL